MELTLEALEQHWLPFSNNREFKREPRLFVSASGMYYRSQHGHKILDVAIIAPAFIASRAEIDLMSSILRDAMSEY